MANNSELERRLQAESLRTEEIQRDLDRRVQGHVEGIRALRGELETKLQELRGQCDALYQTVRRRQAAEGALARHRVYATEHQRLVGAMLQALKRAQGSERLLQAAATEERARETRERELVARERVRAAVQDVFDLQLPRETDFESLFGEEGLADAS